MIAWVGLVIAIAVALFIGVERLMRRLGVEREQPDNSGGGVRDILVRIEEWQRDHARRTR